HAVSARTGCELLSPYEFALKSVAGRNIELSYRILSSYSPSSEILLAGFRFWQQITISAARRRKNDIDRVAAESLRFNTADRPAGFSQSRITGDNVATDFSQHDPNPPPL